MAVARSSTSVFWASVSNCTYPVSMFTAGVRPASTVRAMWASAADQSISPSGVKGSSTADIPVMVRPGSDSGEHVGFGESFRIGIGHDGTSCVAQRSSSSTAAGGTTGSSSAMAVDIGPR